MRPTRYSARWLLPVTSAPLDQGAVLVDEHGRIATFGSRADVPLPEGAIDIDLGECALLPGLVNTHVHLDLAFLRGLIEDIPFHDWIATVLRARRDAPLSGEERLAVARSSCAEALAAGMTTCATTEDSDAGMLALLESGMRGIAYREVFGPSPSQRDASMAAVAAQIERMREHETDLVRTGISPHAPYTVSDELYSAVARFALEHDLPVAAHIAESEDEDELVRHGRGVFAARLVARGIATPVRARSPIALLARTGILDVRPLLIHCIRVDEEDIARIEQSGATVAHCPAANSRLGHGVAPVPALLDAGVTVGLGTDSVGSNNRLDLLEEGRYAQMLQRATLRDPALLPAPTLLRMATLDGARSLGIEHRTGSIDTGRDADLCAVRLDAPSLRPVHDPVTAIFHSARAPDVTLTMVRGRVLYRDGRHLTLDARAAAAAVDVIAERVRGAVRTAAVAVRT
jgi:cytosine/adenosine deaminase-related metal-dependent hydrolase